MKKANRKGGAAVVAVLIIIMLVAVGSAVMVVTGRNSIQANKTLDVPVKHTDESSTVEESSSVDESSSQPEPEPEPEVNYVPQLSADYETIETKDLTCKSAILVDADTNEIIAGYKYDKKIYPASLTKLLTLLVAVENTEDMDAEYKFTDEDIDPLIEEHASRAGFEAGEKVKVKDLLYASILVSGADGTVGLANSVAGSEEAFVELMNKKISELGLEGTQFVNASGLHSKKHYSTVQDIAAITKACLENETCKEIMCAETYTTSKTKQHKDGIELTSIFASRYMGYWVDCNGDGEGDADILGGKTGFTDEALYTLATVCKKDEKDYICVTAKSESELVAVEDTIAILENYLPNGEAIAASDDSTADSEPTDESSVAE